MGVPFDGQMANAWPHEGIVPVALWDVLVNDEALYSMRDTPWFYASLAKTVLALRAGKAIREGGARLAAHAWDAVAIVGGALDEARARDAFDAARVPLDVVAADPFFACSHAREALAEDGAAYADAVVLDVGRSSIKGSGPTTRIHRPRRVDVEGTNPREELIANVAAALAETCVGQVPTFVLLALPCEGDDRDVLVREILGRAGCASATAAVIDDAVLAAWALSRRTPSQTQTRLVLTLGFGVGAALAARSPAA
jgi:hypothetical protein